VVSDLVQEFSEEIESFDRTQKQPPLRSSLSSSAPTSPISQPPKKLDNPLEFWVSPKEELMLLINAEEISFRNYLQLLEVCVIRTQCLPKSTGH
jgi:hypothetical protein